MAKRTGCYRGRWAIPAPQAGGTDCGTARSKSAAPKLSCKAVYIGSTRVGALGLAAAGFAHQRRFQFGRRYASSNPALRMLR